MNVVHMHILFVGHHLIEIVGLATADLLTETPICNLEGGHMVAWGGSSVR